MLEAHVLQARRNSSLYGPVPSRSAPPMDDYRATRLDLSPGRALYASLSEFQFRRYTPLRVSPAGEVNMKSARDWGRSRAVSPPSHRDCVEAIVCHVDRAYKNIHDWQHFVRPRPPPTPPPPPSGPSLATYDRRSTTARSPPPQVQLAFPCWSLFERYPRAAHYLDIHPTRFKRVAGSGGDMVSTWNPWIAALNAQYSRAGVRFLSEPNQARDATHLRNFLWAEVRPSPHGRTVRCADALRRAFAAGQRQAMRVGREHDRGDRRLRMGRAEWRRAFT